MKRNGRPVFPRGSILKAKGSLYQLQKQKEAIELLQSMPDKAHRNLLRLFMDRKQVEWENFDPQNVDEWRVLKSTDISGYQKQRQFVEKHLLPPILESWKAPQVQVKLPLFLN